MAREDGSGTVAVGAPQHGQSAVCRAEFFSLTRARERETKKIKMRLALCRLPTMPASIRSAIPSPIAPEMDAETLLAAERVGHRLGNRAKAKLDNRVVGDQAGDVVGDGAVDRPRRPRRQFHRRHGGRHQHID
jgi:hypothetical protein